MTKVENSFNSVTIAAQHLGLGYYSHLGLLTRNVHGNHNTKVVYTTILLQVETVELCRELCSEFTPLSQVTSEIHLRYARRKTAELPSPTT